MCTCSSNVALAQFYDNDDEIIFYERVDKHHINSCARWMVFNFAGKKACSVCIGQIHGVGYTCTEMLQDEYYFEKIIFDNKRIKILNYSSEESTSNNIVYKNTYGVYDYVYNTSREFKYDFIFSADRETLKWVNHSDNGYVTYKRISKQDFYEYLQDTYNKTWRDRSSTNTIHE